MWVLAEILQVGAVEEVVWIADGAQLDRWPFRHFSGSLKTHLHLRNRLLLFFSSFFEFCFCNKSEIISLISLISWQFILP